MIKKASSVGLLGIIIVVIGATSSYNRLPLDPIVLGLAPIPLLELLLVRRSLQSM